MHSQTELHERLVELAESATPSEGYEVRVRARARGIKMRRRIASGIAGAVCLAVVLGVVRVVGWGATAQLAAPAPDGPFLGWAPAGSVDQRLIDEAVKVWDHQQSAEKHNGIRTLVTAHDAALGSVVILQGYDNHDDARLAFFTSDSSSAGALRLRADRPVPDPSSTQVISLVSPRLSGHAGEASSDYWGAYAIALGMPGVTQLQVSSTTIDDHMRGGSDGSTSRLVVQPLPIYSTAENISIAGFVRSHKVFTADGEDGAVGDALAVPGVVLSRSGQQLTVSLSGSKNVQLGAFAVAPSGLVGQVTSVDMSHLQATIDLVTSSGFAAHAHTDISNVSGLVHGTDGSLVMQQIPSGPKDEVNDGNRVLIPDPAQRSDSVGAVTVGRAEGTKPADADQVKLTPTVDFAQLRKVAIMTPYTAVGG